jgi:hypothetical protein
MFGLSLRRTAAIAVAVTASIGAGVAAIAAANASSTTTVVVYGFSGKCPPTNWANPLVKPTHAFFSLPCEDGIKHIKWQHWSRSAATGSGQHLQFNGTGFTPQSATIALSQVRVHDGHRYFSHMVIRSKTMNGHHHTEVLNWGHDKGIGWLWLYAKSARH